MSGDFTAASLRFGAAIPRAQGWTTLRGGERLVYTTLPVKGVKLVDSSNTGLRLRLDLLLRTFLIRKFALLLETRELIAVLPRKIETGINQTLHHFLLSHTVLASVFTGMMLGMK